MRRIALSEKKVRGVPRRLRALKKWSDSFAGWFPDELNPTDRYCNWKIPVLSSLVEGKQAKRSIQIECAQQLINACAHLISAKPPSLEKYRATCSIVLPAIFDSRICIYMDEAFYQGRVTVGTYEFGTITSLSNRSLAKEWGISLPAGVHELGVYLSFRSEEDDWSLVGERWYFGEVL